MAYPSSLDTFGVPAGTSTLSNPDHALEHRTLGSAVGTIERLIGTTQGTNMMRDFAAGQIPVRMSTSNLLAHNITGTIDNSLLGTPLINGGTVGTARFQGGTIAAAAIGTPTIIGGTIAISGTVTPLSFGASIVPTVVTLTDAAGGTLALNSQAGQVMHLVMGTTAGNRTFGTPANSATDGQTLTLRIKQNSNNTGTAIFPAIYRFGNSGTPTLGTQSTYNYYGFRYNSVDTKWDFQGNSGGLI